MKNTLRLTLATLAGVILVVAAWGLPPAATTPGSTHPVLLGEQTPSATQSVSGKIASVAKDSFTLTVPGSQTSAGQQLMQQAEPKTMTFHIDKNTAVEGKLKVGANAEVTYREEGGKNIAVSVHVAS